MGVTVREVIGYARNSRVNAATAKRLGIDNLPRRRLDERWPTEKNRTLIANDNSFVAHRWHVGSTGRA